MENIFIALLPPWVETGTQPAFYDQESGTVLQQTARMYAKVNELTSNFNAFSKDVSDTVNDYIEQFNALYNYVHDYFDNLDVQNEINNKLDAMVADGSFQILLDAYVQPKLDELDNKIDETKTDLESELSNEARIREVSDGNLQSQINGLASGSPLVASSTSEMTDKNRVYVNTTDGHWYYWDGSAWTDGGTYQASEDSDTVNELISHVNCVDADLGAISKIVYLDPDNFEVGSLSVVDNVLESRPGYTGRVSSKLANGISLKRGQTIALRSEASGVYRFGGYKYVDGTYTSIYWKTDPFIVPEDGVYYLTISKITEETVVNIYDYTNQVNILKEKYDAINVTSRNDTMLYMENLANYFEMGNIIIGASPARPVYGNSTTRYRTRMNSYLYLREGDIIEFSEAGWRLYIGWYDESGNWHYHSGWVDDRYIITQTGYYVFVCRTQPETTISDFTNAISKLTLKHGYVINTELLETQSKNDRVDYCIKSIAHRGYRRFYPENTIPAFQGASIYGFNAIETDVKWTSDGVAVLLHDATINRTARNLDGTAIETEINISDITYDEALTYDFGIYMGSQFAGTKIPTVEQAVSFCKKSGIDIYLDFAGGTPEQIHGVMDTVRKYDMLKHTSFITSGPTIIEYFGAYIDTARVGYIVTDVNQSAIDKAINLKTGKNEVFIDYMYTSTSMNDTLRNQLINNNIGLECYTPNYIVDFLTNMDAYVSGVTSEWFTAKDIANYTNYPPKYYLY